jgi:hypothetical protein
MCSRAGDSPRVGTGPRGAPCGMSVFTGTVRSELRRACRGTGAGARHGHSHHPPTSQDRRHHHDSSQSWRLSVPSSPRVRVDMAGVDYAQTLSEHVALIGWGHATWKQGWALANGADSNLDLPKLSESD